MATITHGQIRRMGKYWPVQTVLFIPGMPRISEHTIGGFETHHQSEEKSSAAVLTHQIPFQAQNEGGFRLLDHHRQQCAWRDRSSALLMGGVARALLKRFGPTQVLFKKARARSSDKVGWAGNKILYPR